MNSPKAPRVLILGGGIVGMTVAKRLEHTLHKEVSIEVVDPRPYMQYAAFLPEAGAGSIDARDVVAPLRIALAGMDILQANVTKIDHANRTVTVRPEDGDPYDIEYDILVVALGAVSRVLPIPGLAENAIGFKNVEEAIAVRNHVLNRIDVAASTPNPKDRERMLTFTFVGGGFTGVEAIAEIEDMARYAVEHAYPSLSPDELHFIMIEGAPRILPEVTEPSGEWSQQQLEKRGIKFYLNSYLESCVDGHVVTSTGEQWDSDTIVWTAGIRSNPVLAEASDLPLDKIGRVTVLPTLQVCDADGNVVPDVWAAGDCTAVPDIVRPGKFCPPNAQYAVREAKQLAKNIEAQLHDEPLGKFHHRNVGVVASLGLKKGVAEFMGGRIKLKGWPAWVAHRAYHVYAMPTGNRKARVLMGWIGQEILGREIVSLGSVEDPRREFLHSFEAPAAVRAPVSPQEPESAAATGVAGEARLGTGPINREGPVIRGKYVGPEPDLGVPEDGKSFSDVDTVDEAVVREVAEDDAARKAAEKAAKAVAREATPAEPVVVAQAVSGSSE